MLHFETISPDTLGLLKRICQDPDFNDFSLVGGTNLALRYGHRVSVDLDFFSSKKFDVELIASMVSRKFRDFELLFQRNQTIIFEIEKVRVDFVLYPFDWLNPFEHFDQIRMASVEDIVPMKLQSITTRQSKKDYWDIACLLEHNNLKDLLEIMKSKFPFVDLGFIIQALTHFEDAEDQPDPVVLNDWNWPMVKRKIISSVVSYTKSLL